MKKPQLVLHIGTFKTGTTALQNALVMRSDVLVSRGILYSGWQDDGVSMNHSFLAAALLSESGTESAERYFAELACECQREAASRAIVSAEGFYALEFADIESWKVRPALKPEDFCRSRRECLLRLRDRVADRFEIKVVVYLRRQDYFLNSLYNQLVKDVYGYTGTILDFVRDWGVLGDYAMVLDLWADVFGAHVIVVRTYERQYQALDVVDDFWGGVLGLEPAREPSNPTAQINRSNPRLSRDVLEYKRIANHFCQEWSFQEKKEFRDDLVLLASRTAESPSLGMVLSPAQRANLLAGYEVSNAHVATRYLGTVKPLFQEPAPPQELPHGGYSGLTVEKAIEISTRFRLLQKGRTAHNTQLTCSPPLTPVVTHTRISPARFWKNFKLLGSRDLRWKSVCNDENEDPLV